MNYYREVLKKYAVFSGRSGRAEYWYFFLFNIIISIALHIISSAIGDEMNILSLIYGLAILVPGLAVIVRRLHDIGKSGWMILILFIPFIGVIWAIVLLATKGQPGENKYGPNPNMPSSSAVPTPSIPV